MGADCGCAESGRESDCADSSWADSDYADSGWTSLCRASLCRANLGYSIFSRAILGHTVPIAQSQSHTIRTNQIRPAQSAESHSSVMPLPNISCNICSQLMPSASTWLIAVASGVGTL